MLYQHTHILQNYNVELIFIDKNDCFFSVKVDEFI